MRLRTIWSITEMPIRERVLRTIDWAARVAACNLPNRVRYWATLVAIGKATNSGPFANEDVLAVPLDEILKRLEGGLK